MADPAPERADEGQLRGRHPGLFPLRQSGEGNQDASIWRGIKQLADSYLVGYPTFAAQSRHTMPFLGHTPDTYTPGNGIRFNLHAVFEHPRRARCRLLGSFSRPDAVFGILVAADRKHKPDTGDEVFGRPRAFAFVDASRFSVLHSSGQRWVSPVI